MTQEDGKDTAKGRNRARDPGSKKEYQPKRSSDQQDAAGTKVRNLPVLRRKKRWGLDP